MPNITINNTHTTFYKRVFATLFGSASPGAEYMLHSETVREKMVRRRVVAVIVFFAAIIGYELLKKMIRHLFSASKTSQGIDQQIAETQNQLQKQIEIKNLQSELLEKQTNITDLQRQLLEKQGIIGTSTVQLAANQAEIAVLKSNLDNLRQRKQQGGSLATRVTKRTVHPPYVELSKGSPSAFLKALETPSPPPRLAPPVPQTGVVEQVISGSKLKNSSS